MKELKRGEFRKYLSADELQEYETLLASPEVKAAKQEIRKKYQAKTALYNLRALYKQGTELLKQN